MPVNYKGRPNHDHDHFWVHLAGPHFSFFGYPGWRTKCLFYTAKHRETKRIFSSDVPSNAVLVWHQMQNFFGTLWLWLWLGRPPKVARTNWNSKEETLNEALWVANQSAPWTEVKSVQTTASCLAGLYKGLLGRGIKSFPKSHRDALKGTNLRGRTPICGFLRVPAVFCGLLRKSTVFCENLRFPNALFLRKGENLQESAKICENLRLGSVCPLRFVPLSAPWSLAPGQTRFAPVQPHVAPMQTAFCSHVRKDLLRPLQSTLGQISWFDSCPRRLGLQLVGQTSRIEFPFFPLYDTAIPREPFLTYWGFWSFLVFPAIRVF